MPLAFGVVVDNLPHFFEGGRDEMNHGRHVKMMGKGAAQLLGDVGAVEAFLTGLVDALGMRMLGEPILHDVAIDLAALNVEPFEDEGGVTGTVVLTTSHVALHTWPVRSFFILDVFSCRDFDPATVRAEMVRCFSAFEIKTTDVDVSYPEGVQPPVEPDP